LVIELRNGGLSAKPPFIQQSAASRLGDLERDDVRWYRQDGADFVAWQERGKRRCSASPPTSDAGQESGMRQKRRRPKGVAPRAIMTGPSNVITL
jgi:hypothetical protein